MRTTEAARRSADRELAQRDQCDEPGPCVKQRRGHADRAEHAPVARDADRFRVQRGHERVAVARDDCDERRRIPTGTHAPIASRRAPTRAGRTALVVSADRRPAVSSSQATRHSPADAASRS